VAESFLQYAETVQERGTVVDMTLGGNDLQLRAAMMQKMPFTDTGGELYRTPSVSFTPWFDLHELLSNDDDNVIGRIASESRSQGKSSSGGSSGQKLAAHHNVTSWVQRY